MQQEKIVSKLFAVGAVLELASAPAAQACTGIRVIAADGTVVHARTLEFGIDLKSDVILEPRGYSRTGTTPDGKPGKRWTSKYATLGANAFDIPKGAAREHEKDEHGNVIADYTIWTSANDLKASGSISARMRAAKSAWSISRSRS